MSYHIELAYNANLSRERRVCLTELLHFRQLKNIKRAVERSKLYLFRILSERVFH